MSKLTYREKQLVSFRLAYLGGYTNAFQKKVAWLLAHGYSANELSSRCVDDRMKIWLNDAIRAISR